MSTQHYRTRLAVALRQRVRLGPCLGLLTGFVMGSTSIGWAAPETDSPYRNLGVFARALSHIQTAHVEPVDPQRLIYGAMRGMVRELDPHSAFLDPDELRLLTSDAQGRYGGVGVEIDVRDGWLTVLTAFPDQPAARAGVRPGDRFLAIDGIPARDMPIGEATQRMRGEPGTRVEVRLRRPGTDEAVAASLTREVIRIESVEARVLPDRTVYLRLRAFNETTFGGVRQALSHASDRTRTQGGITGLVLDLRDNPGGLVDAAAAVADIFLDRGLIVAIRGRGGAIQREIAATAGTVGNWPVVVLVNGYSASAAEIVAGALQDHRRGVIVGTRTFGKASVQNVIELPDGSALKLTTARYFTPSGRSIQALGIEPDVWIDQLDSAVVGQARLRRDDVSEATLERHLSAPNAPPDSVERRQPRAAPEPNSHPQRFTNDYQAQMALNMLRTLIAASPTPRP